MNVALNVTKFAGKLKKNIEHHHDDESESKFTKTTSSFGKQLTKTTQSFFPQPRDYPELTQQELSYWNEQRAL